MKKIRIPLRPILGTLTLLTLVPVFASWKIAQRTAAEQTKSCEHPTMLEFKPHFWYHMIEIYTVVGYVALGALFLWWIYWCFTPIFDVGTD